jgi:hypothetical protein
MATSCSTYQVHRFLPEYDDVLLSHADRARIIPGNRRVPLPPGGGGSRGTVLVDGFLCGTWKTERARGKVRLAIGPFRPLSKEDRDAVVEEGERLLRFVAEPQGADEYVVLLDEMS